ncbi:MAG: DUF1647 domain-containing protein [Fibrobacteria bacterium]|nr:DUF1647 domain-containing protein [Fibrobacteria bacterium]
MPPWLQALRSGLRRLELLPSLATTGRTDPDDLTVVTGASASHFKSLLQMLGSVRAQEPSVDLVAWDLGLEPEQHAQLRRSFPDVEVRTFDYPVFPDWMWIHNHDGCYAWKPVIISDMVREKGGLILWMDAGNFLDAPLDRIRRFIRHGGFHSPRSPGTLQRWTHPATLRRLAVPRGLWGKPNLAANLVGIDSRHPTARVLVEAWRAAALDKETIAPVGSDASNHRQDQALLSCLAHMLGVVKSSPRAYYGVRVHQDCD